jgi:hypothetical protein
MVFYNNVWKTTKFICLVLLIQLNAHAISYVYDDSEVMLVEITVDSESLDWIYANVQSDSLHPAIVHISNAYYDETLESVGFRLRGNTSRNAAKKSFKLDFNHFVPGRRFHGMEKLNLNGEHNDPSIIRSKLCWDFYKDAGVPASRASHAAVYINGEYYGLYISVEHIDDRFLDTYFPQDSGNLWKCLWPADLAYLGEDPELYKFESGDRRTYELKTNKDEDDYSALARLISVINLTSDEALADSLERILDVSSVLKYMAMDVLTGSWDDYWFLKNNFYLYHNPEDGLMHLIPYDYDNSFGIDWFNIDWALRNPYSFGNTDHVLCERLLDIPKYFNLYSHILEVFDVNITAISNWSDRLDTLKTRITPWATIDMYRTLDYNFSLQDFEQSFSLGHYENQHVKRGIREFVSLRSPSLQSQLYWLDSAPAIYDLLYYPHTPLPTDTIFIEAAVFDTDGVGQTWIKFVETSSGAVEYIPMQENPGMNNQHIEDLDRWTGFIPPLGIGGAGSFTIVAADFGENTSEYPRLSEIQLTAASLESFPLRFNEFMPKNDNAVLDPQGDYDDWLEIVNLGSDSIQLGGMWLSDNFSNPAKWIFPDTLLAAGAYLIIWCDEDGGDPGLHANFKLSASGEDLKLSTASGLMLDSLAFAASPPDESWYLPCIADLSQPLVPGNWQLTPEHTPGIHNGGCLDAVSDLQISVIGNSINLEWTAGNAQNWRIYRSNDAYTIDGYELVASVVEPFYSESIGSSHKYFYLVKSVDFD